MSTTETLKATAARLGLSELAMAAYLGVPVFTYRKWINGTRSMDSAPRRLLEVLEMIETMIECEGLHTELIEAAQAQGGPQEARKPLGKGKGAPRSKKPASAAPDATAAPPAPWVHAADAIPDWMNPGT